MAERETRPIVLHLITRFLDGGAEKTTEHTLETLQAASEEYELRLGTGAEYDQDRLADLEARGVEVVVFPLIRHYNPVSSLLSVFTVAHYLSQEDVDILHTHSTEAGIIGRLAGWLAETPVILHEIHGDPITDDRNRALNALVNRLERICASITSRIVVKSERIRESYLNRGIGSPEKYELIYHGVDTESFSVAAEQRAQRTDSQQGEVRLLYVGRLTDGKGLFDLLDAVQFLPTNEIHLDIVGHGPLRSSLSERISRNGLDESVSIHGHREDIPAVMASADILVLPSYREGTPRVITEARAAGLPVVSTDVAGIPEMVLDGETGYLVEPGDVDSLRNRIRDLIESPDLRRKMGERTRVGLETFERETAAEAYRDLYGDVLSSDE